VGVIDARNWCNIRSIAYWLNILKKTSLHRRLRLNLRLYDD
jgi:hypothetical protein